MSALFGRSQVKNAGLWAWPRLDASISLLEQTFDEPNRVRFRTKAFLNKLRWALCSHCVWVEFHNSSCWSSVNKGHLWWQYKDSDISDSPQHGSWEVYQYHFHSWSGWDSRLIQLCCFYWGVYSWTLSQSHWKEGVRPIYPRLVTSWWTKGIKKR